jgi:hypothetical protein
MFMPYIFISLCFIQRCFRWLRLYSVKQMIWKDVEGSDCGQSHHEWQHALKTNISFFWVESQVWTSSSGRRAARWSRSVYCLVLYRANHLVIWKGTSTTLIASPHLLLCCLHLSCEVYYPSICLQELRKPWWTTHNIWPLSWILNPDLPNAKQKC